MTPTHQKLGGVSTIIKSVIAASLVLVATGYAATTISTNILTGGTLGVTGQTTLTTASSTGLTATALYATTATLTSASVTNASTTNQTLFGAYYDSVQSKGTSGQVLWSTATSTLWVATSTLGISGGAPLASPAFTGNGSYSGTWSDTSTSVQAPATSGATITIANNISSLRITTSPTIYDITINMPATPVDGQTVTISTVGTIRTLTLGGNGKTIGYAATGLLGNTSITYRYRASATNWDLEVEPARQSAYSSTAGNTIMRLENKTKGIEWDWLNYQSWSWVLFDSYGLMQGTADGQSVRTGQVALKTENTLDVTDSGANNGKYSWSGFLAKTYNSSIAYGGGATNDAPLLAGLANVGQKFSGGNNYPAWTGAPAGVNNYLSFQNADLLIGVIGASGFQVAKFDKTTGNFTTNKARLDASKTKVTVGATQTIPDNISTYIVKGAVGTATVTFPATPVDGQVLTISFSGVVGAITFNGNGKTLNGAFPSATVAGDSWQFIYDSADTTWYRVSGRTS